MSHRPRPDFADLISYAIGRSTPDEATWVRQWVADSHEHQRLFHNVQRLVEAVRHRPALSQTDAADAIVRAFAAHVAQDQDKEGRGIGSLPNASRAVSAQQGLVRREPQAPNWVGPREGVGLGARAWRRWVGSFSAIAVLIVGICVSRSGSSHTPGVTRSYTTGVNQQGIVTLDDSTRVILAPQTTLRLVAFSKQARTVSVDGSAYFQVVRAGGAPFEVRSGSAVVHVLGTAFLVNHAPSSSRVRVSVEEGKVHVAVGTRPNAGVVVAAGYVGDITDSSIVVNAVADSGAGTEWLPGKLVFHHMPVPTVLQTLSRWYGYQFRYADSTLSQQSVTIGLSVTSAASALATLEQILGVHLTVVGDTITLTPSLSGRGKEIPKVRSYDVWTPTREVGR